MRIRPGDDLIAELHGLAGRRLIGNGYEEDQVPQLITQATGMAQHAGSGGVRLRLPRAAARVFGAQAIKAGRGSAVRGTRAGFSGD